MAPATCYCLAYNANTKITLASHSRFVSKDIKRLGSRNARFLYKDGREELKEIKRRKAVPPKQMSVDKMVNGQAHKPPDWLQEIHWCWEGGPLTIRLEKDYRCCFIAKIKIPSLLAKWRGRMPPSPNLPKLLGDQRIATMFKCLLPTDHYEPQIVTNHRSLWTTATGLVAAVILGLGVESEQWLHIQLDNSCLYS